MALAVTQQGETAPAGPSTPPVAASSQVKPEAKGREPREMPARSSIPLQLSAKGVLVHGICSKKHLPVTQNPSPECGGHCLSTAVAGNQMLFEKKKQRLGGPPQWTPVLERLASIL